MEEGRTMDPTVVAQRAAIQEVRRRYERGELSLDAFHRALDALVLTESADECQAVLRAIASSSATRIPMASLAALDPAPPEPARRDRAADPMDAAMEYERIDAILGNTHKTRHPWRLARHTLARSILGDLKLDLTRATLPAYATLDVTVVLGSALIYVPRAMRVRVDSHLVLGEVKALGETVGGIMAASHVEHAPPPESALAPGAAQARRALEASQTAPQIDIVVHNIAGSVKIVLVDRPVVSFGEMVRQSVRFLAERFSRGLQEQYGQGYGQTLPQPRSDGMPDQRT
jgi:hypothetical protein